MCGKKRIDTVKKIPHRQRYRAFYVALFIKILWPCINKQRLFAVKKSFDDVRAVYFNLIIQLIRIG